MGLHRRRPAPAVVEVVVVVVMGVVAREALAGVSPIGVFPFRFLMVRLNGSTMTVSVLRLFFFSLATSLGVGLSNEVFDCDGSGIINAVPGAAPIVNAEVEAGGFWWITSFSDGTRDT